MRHGQISEDHVWNLLVTVKDGQVGPADVTDTQLLVGTCETKNIVPNTVIIKYGVCLIVHKTAGPVLKGLCAAEQLTSGSVALDFLDLCQHGILLPLQVLQL